jgi:RNA polymerase sigma-70 factor (ECF subfamily)
LNEEVIIRELRSRNTIAFDYVFNYYYSGLCAFAHKYVPEKEVVEDIVQDFFVTLWMESPRLEIKTSLKSYLFTSIHNRCIDWHKHKKVLEKYRKNFLLKNEESEIRSEEMVVESELRAAIQKGLEQCSPRAREIFEMSRIRGLSNQQIAEELGLSKRTVELQISNTLKILRTSLRDYLPVWMITWLLG